MAREFRIYSAPRAWDGDWVHSCNLLDAVVEQLVGRPVVRTRIPAEADLNIVNVFDIRDGLREFSRSRRRRFGSRMRSPIERSALELETVLTAFNLSRPTIIQVAENLDRAEWKDVGELIRASSLPRTTFWPQEMDPAGVRLPYWWNYVRWPELHRPNARYARYGTLYELDVLLSPLDLGSLHSRRDSAVLVTSNMEFPRAELVYAVEQYVPVKVTGGEAGRGRPKRDILQDFRYALVPENSLGYGYCTEKVPEAWMSGCLPLGVTQQHGSDWPHLPFRLDPEGAMLIRTPLLLERPRLTAVFDYVGRVLDGLPGK